MMSCRKQERRLSGAAVLREVAKDAALLLAAERRIGEDHLDALGLADLGQTEAQRIVGIDARRIHAVQEQVHLRQQEGKRLGLAAEDAGVLQDRALLDGVGLPLQMGERLDQEAPGAARWVEHGFPELGRRRLDHEAHHRARRVELTGIACRVAHFAQQGLVEAAEDVDLLGRVEPDAVHQVDHVAQQVAALHAVGEAPEHGRHHVAAVAPAVVAAQAAQVGEQSWAGSAVREHRLLCGKVRSADRRR